MQGRQADPDPDLTKSQIKGLMKKREDITQGRARDQTTISDEDKADKARETMLFSLSKMPDITVPYDYTTARSVAILFEVGENEKGVEIAKIMGDRAIDMVDYLITKGEIDQTFQLNMAILGELQRTLYEYGEAELAKQYDDAYTRFYEQMSGTRAPGRSDF